MPINQYREKKMAKYKPVVLLILDGWGHRVESEYNAIAQANTPVWDDLMSNHPHTLLSAAGKDVGLPKGQMGNSEVGHICLGAGRVIYQDLERINHAIENGQFYKNPVITKALLEAKKKDKRVHIMGLVSDGGVHSHVNHIIATLNLARRLDVTNLFVHAFLDGRDTPPKSAHGSLSLIEQWFAHYPYGKLASLCGRYYAMDRDKRYDRTQLAYDCLTQGKTDYKANDFSQALYAAYERDETDEFVKPTLIGKPALVQDGDVVLFLNFRADRARQLCHAFQSADFDGFVRSKQPKLSRFVTLTEYDKRLNAQVAFAPERVTNSLGEVIQNENLTQLRLAETEKYAHVTFFFNGTREEPFNGEERKLIPSPKVATYDLKPEMSANEVTDTLTQAIDEQRYDLIICNYANADMVGHTGNMEAAIKAVETLDQSLGKIISSLKKVQGEMLITADHGNVEMMHNVFTGQAHTAHTTELVPLVYVGPRDLSFKAQGMLADVAPTILKLMDITIPKEMTGSILLL